MRSALSAKPDLIVHTAAIRDIEACEANLASAMAVNASGAQNVALAANMCDCSIVHISTDAVYDGVKTEPYTELDAANPVNVYGRSKLVAEGLVMAAGTRHFILRVPLLFGSRGSRSKNALYKMIMELRSGQAVRASVDQTCNPSYTRDIAQAILRIVGTQHWGLYLLCNDGHATRYEHALMVARLVGAPDSQVVPASMTERPTRRPRNTTMDCSRAHTTFGISIQPWHSALRQCIEEMGFSAALSRLGC